MYQAEIFTAVPSDHEYGDKHRHNLLDFEVEMKKIKIGKAAAASSVALRGLSKADAGRESNTEPGIA